MKDVVERLPKEKGEFALTGGEGSDADCPNLKLDKLKGAAAGREVPDEVDEAGG